MIAGARSVAEDLAALEDLQTAFGHNTGVAGDANTSLFATGPERFIVIEEIGRGGMGTVQRAYDPRLQREVALKSVRAASPGRAESLLLAEAQAMAKLSHPNVVAVYDVQKQADDVVIAMEYVHGTTLQRWVAEGRTWREVIATFVAAGRGLAAAHRAGVLHRDFKPANVLIGHDGRVRVADFGLARARPDARCPATEIDDHDDESSLLGFGFDRPRGIGTPRYMAPEQYAGADLSPATDQYAFCVALWEALTGHPPFAVGLEPRQQGKPPPWPPEVTVPARIRRALERGFAPTPSDRWPTMDALVAQLELDPRKRRRSWLVAGIGLALLSATGAAWGAHRQRLEQRCSGAEEMLADVWDTQRRADVGRAVLATNVAYASGVWARLGPQLDAYAAQWTSMHRSACEATTLRGDQSPAVMDLRMACLHRAKVDLRAVTSLLSRADARVVERAHEVTARLPELERCADVEALRAEVPPPSSSEEDAVEKIRVELAEAKALRDAGKYDDALARMERIAQNMQEVAYPPLAAEVLVELGITRISQGELAAAERDLRHALRAALGNEQWRKAIQSATQLVHVVGWGQSRPHDGLAYAQTASGLLELGDRSLELQLRGTVGDALQRLGRYAQAEEEHRIAVDLARKTLREDDLRLASYHTRLGLNLLLQGRVDAAKAELRAALQLRERRLAPGHPETAHARFNLANALHQDGRFAEAEAEHRRVLEELLEVLGPEHHRVAMARQSLGNALRAQERHTEALFQYQLALQIFRASLGARNIMTAITQLGVGNALTSLGRYAEGERELRQAVAIAEDIQGAAHPRVADLRAFLVRNLLLQERHTEAETLARAVLRTLSAEETSNRPSLPLAHHDLGNALRGQGRHEEAELEQRRALALALERFSAHHPYIASIHLALGESLQDQARFDAAEAHYRRAVDVLQREDPPSAPAALGHAKGLVAEILRARGQLERAEAAYREALAVQLTVTGEDHPSVARLRSGLGRTLLDAGNFARALPLLEQVWASWHDDPRLTSTRRAELDAWLRQARESASPSALHHRR